MDAARFSTVDLTNRCNMMCDPCFMDANQVGFVHELSHGRHQGNSRQRDSDQTAPSDVRPVFRWRADAFALLSGSGSLRAQSRLQLGASRDQRDRIREIERILPRSCRSRFAIMFTCSSTVSATMPTRHRQVGNLFDVKLRAINNLHEAGVEIVLVTTLVNGVNNDQVGSIIRFALDNPEEDFVSLVSAGFVYRTRRRYYRRAPSAAALHLVAPGA